MTDNPVVVAVFLVLGGVFVSAAPVQVFGSETVGIGLMDKGWVQFVADESQPTPLALQAATDPTQPTQPTQPNPSPEQPTQPTQPGEQKKTPKPPKAEMSKSNNLLDDVHVQAQERAVLTIDPTPQQPHA